MTLTTFERRDLIIKPLSQRRHDLDVSAVRPLKAAADVRLREQFRPIALRVIRAREKGASIILMMGGHVIRAGVQRYIIDLMERRYLSCVATNGAAMIHDFELALIGATTESVARYISEGQFGLWQETGRINDYINRGFKEGLGMGEAVGKAIYEGDFAFKDTSVFAAGFRLQIPVTVHVGIGYDIIHEHPNCDGAAAGETSYRDFLRLAKMVENLEGGVVFNFGSAVMAPEVFLKALSMARNAAHGKAEGIRNFTAVVCDIRKLAGNLEKEPPKDDPAYYFRPWKTMLVRTIADGGKGLYVCGGHADTIPALWDCINELEGSAEVAANRKSEIGAATEIFSHRAHRDHRDEKKQISVSSVAKEPLRQTEVQQNPNKVLEIEDLAQKTAALKAGGRKIVHCHGCFDLMHPGHIKYFQAAKKMGDVLIVTVTPDVYVDKGPGRPVFDQQLRAECIAALECVDFVAVNKWPTAEETLKLLRPDVYVKGQEFERLEDKTGKIQREADVVRQVGAELRFTHEIVFSSTRLLEEHFQLTGG